MYVCIYISCFRNVEERKANSGNKKEHSDKSTKYNRRKEKVRSDEHVMAYLISIRTIYIQ